MLSTTDKWFHDFEKWIIYTINLKAFEIYTVYYNKSHFNANVYILETLIYILSQCNYIFKSLHHEWYNNILLGNVSDTLFLNQFKIFQLLSPKSMVL